MKALLPVIVLSLSSACTATPDKRTFNTDEGAIRGYDPVAYFSESAPVRGQSDISYEHAGSTWHFASENNRDLFIADPAAYAPQYGGYCAYAMALGKVVSTDPHAWTIYNGKLYLNYSLPTRNIWSRDIPLYVNQADVNWAQKLETGIDG